MTRDRESHDSVSVGHWGVQGSLESVGHWVTGMSGSLGHRRVWVAGSPGSARVTGECEDQDQEADGSHSCVPLGVTATLEQHVGVRPRASPPQA